jgi:hypothetical protein
MLCFRNLNLKRKIALLVVFCSRKTSPETANLFLFNETKGSFVNILYYVTILFFFKDNAFWKFIWNRLCSLFFVRFFFANYKMAKKHILK